MIDIESATAIAVGNFSISLIKDNPDDFCIVGVEKCNYNSHISSKDFPNFNGRSTAEHIGYILQLCSIAAEGVLCNDCAYNDYIERFNPEREPFQNISVIADQKNIEKIVEAIEESITKKECVVCTKELFIN